MIKHHESSGIFQLIDKKIFDALATKWKVDKGVRTFSTWEMTHALICCFVMRLDSYREVESVLNIPDSTFGDGLRKRHFGFFQDLCDEILLQIRGRTKNRKVKNAIRQILAIDSTECRVHGSLFDLPSWRQKLCDGRKASLKLHVVWNVDGEWIDDFLITGSRRSDIAVAKRFAFQSDRIYVFDRAYIDLSYWLKITQAGSHFVTRLKKTPRKAELHKCVLSKEDLQRHGVLWTGEWTPSEAACYRNGIKPLQLKLRQIIYRDKLTGKLFDFVTSDWESAPEEIAQIYKRRWSVELLFRWLKGHLNIRYFPTRTKNAVKVQLATAILVQLLLQLKRVVEHFKGTSWELLRNVRAGLIRKCLTASGPPDGCRWTAASKESLAS